MERIKPKRSLGQNFLNDKNIAQKMVRLFAPSQTDTVIEIGPGTGVLTEYLYGRCRCLYLIEKDKRAVDILRKRFENDNNVKVIQEDILEFTFSGIVDEGRTVRVIGNIPYNITSPILFHLLEQKQYVSDSMFLVQREVVDRINAQPGTPDYGILSVLLQTWATTNFLFTVPATVFYPRPSVTSAVIHITFDRRQPEIPDDRFYREIIRGTFGKRRKMLRASLKSLYSAVSIDPDDFTVDLHKRPEECTVNEFIILTNEIHNVIRRKHEKND
jgi:16S rRNA (adenine1518-N6/adenine1519-N6)-dimethyltransferase